MVSHTKKFDVVVAGGGVGGAATVSAIVPLTLWYLAVISADPFATGVTNPCR